MRYQIETEMGRLWDLDYATKRYLKAMDENSSETEHWLQKMRGYASKPPHVSIAAESLQRSDTGADTATRR